MPRPILAFLRNLAKPPAGTAGMALAVPMYLLSPVLVLGAGVAIGLLVPVAPIHWVLTGVFVALNAVSFPLRKQGCSQCRMRNVCPGSAARSA